MCVYTRHEMSPQLGHQSSDMLPAHPFDELLFPKSVWACRNLFTFRNFYARLDEEFRNE